MQKITRLILLLSFSIALASTTSNETLSDSITHTFTNFTGGDKLWNGLLHDCKVPTMSCIQKNVYHYLDDTFTYKGDVSFGQIMKFKRNSNEFTETTNKIDAENDIEDEPRSKSPIEEVTEALHGKSVGFLMTHDMELNLPETLFDGSTLQVSPRGFEGDGVLVKLNLVPKELQNNNGVGRIFFKKIKKFFKNKLLMAFMSIVLVIGLIKAKLMFLMPILVGVGTAKKIILKLLLFLFPALTHLFKLCSYYHDSYHSTKYHHHHHQIAHVHHVPSLHHNLPDVHGPPPDPHIFKHEHDGFEFSGPGLGPEYISNRNYFEHHTPNVNDENEIKSWGLGHAQGQQPKGNTRRGHQPKPPLPININQIDELAMQAEKEVLLKTQLRQEQQRLRQENLRLQEQLRQEMKLQEQLKLQALMFAQQKTKLQPQMQPAHLQAKFQNAQMQQAQMQQAQQHIQQAQMQQAQHIQQAQMQQAQLQHAHGQQQKIQVPTANAPHDPFYSPILQKIDKIFLSLSFNDEPCRERLVCSMYKNPMKFSPHSNLISAELSRDSKDLRKPTTSNDAVVRFYKYVQAARDGQDQRECLRLYPSCNINTEL